MSWWFCKPSHHISFPLFFNFHLNSFQRLTIWMDSSHKRPFGKRYWIISWLLHLFFSKCVSNQFYQSIYAKIDQPWLVQNDLAHWSHSRLADSLTYLHVLVILHAAEMQFLIYMLVQQHYLTRIGKSPTHQLRSMKKVRNTHLRNFFAHILLHRIQGWVWGPD